MNEAETRAEHIDPALAAAGWGVVAGSRPRREFTIAPGRIEPGGRRGRSLTADYVLEYRNPELAKVVIGTRFDSKQQVFVEFVLSPYVRVGVDALGQDKLNPSLRLRHRDSLADA